MILSVEQKLESQRCFPLGEAVTSRKTNGLGHAMKRANIKAELRPLVDRKYIWRCEIAGKRHCRVRNAERDRDPVAWRVRVE